MSAARPGQGGIPDAVGLDAMASFNIAAASFAQRRNSQPPTTSDQLSGMHSGPMITFHPPSVRPLEGLSQIFVADLQPETHYRGRYLLLRCIIPPFAAYPVKCMVDDQKGSVTMLALQPLTSKLDWPAPGTLAQNDILVFKEPHTQKGRHESGIMALESFHVSDIVKLEGNKIPMMWSPKTPTKTESADGWRLKGNENLKKGYFWHAVQK